MILGRFTCLLFNKTGPGILVTHSHSGGMGLAAAIKNQNIKAIVSYEPGSGFLFVEGEVPAPIPMAGGSRAASGVPLSDFMKLTRTPIIIYNCDFIPALPIDNPGQDGRTTRYLSGAAAPEYFVNKYFSTGAYILYSHGIEKFITRNTLMLAFRPSFSNIPITKNITARFTPEIYHLSMDKDEGVFFNGRLSISRKNCPLSVSALINKPLKSTIPSDYDLLWNLGLSYTFTRKYIGT